MIWKLIPSFPPYEASEDGQIRRVGRVLAQRSNGHGYLRVTVSCANIQYSPYVHQLVCEAFHGPRPPGHETRHRDGVRDNNRETNVAWSTKAENEADKIIHGTLNQGERNGQCDQLTGAQVLVARDRVRSGERLIDVAADFGVNRATLGDAITGRKWRHLPGATGALRRMLTEAEVKGIREAVAAGDRKADVARQYGIRWGTVQRIVNGTRHASAAQ